MRKVDPTAHAQARARILDAALKVFAVKGYHDASMNEVAKAAGLAKAALYHYFPGKHALLEALHTEMWNSAMSDLAAMPRPKSLHQAFTITGQGYLHHFGQESHAAMMRVAFDLSIQEPELMRSLAGLGSKLDGALVEYFRPCFPKGTSKQAILTHVMPFFGALFHYLFVLSRACPAELLPCSAPQYLDHLISVFAVLPRRTRGKK
jgi:AcrR family transcriptional regulator